MTEPTHADIQRSVGVLEGRMTGIEAELVQVREMVEKVADQMADVHRQLSFGKGAWRALAAIGGAVIALSGLGTWLIDKIRG